MWFLTTVAGTARNTQDSARGGLGATEKIGDIRVGAGVCTWANGTHFICCSRDCGLEL